MDCGECTLCCKLLELHEIPSSIDEYCSQCIPNVGCSIHATNKPEECCKFQCMWSQMEHAGGKLRPDKCGILFERIADDVICARLEIGRMIHKLVFRQINLFINEGFSVLVFRGKDKKFFLSKSHTKKYVIEKVHDRSRIH